MNKEMRDNVESFKARHPEYGVKSSARGKGLEASVVFLSECGMTAEQIDCSLETGPRSFEGGQIEQHTWVKLGNTNIDLTVRQYNPLLSFPLVWQDV